MQLLKKLQYHLLVLLATTLVAGSFLASEKLAGIINPVSLTLLRFVGASLILLPFIVLKPNWLKKVFITFPRAFVISFFYAAFFIGLFEALNTTTSLNTGTLFTLVPFITAVLSLFVFKEAISKKHLIVYAIGILATCWVIFKGQLALLAAFSLNSGDLIFLASLIFMVMYSITMKLLYRNDDMPILVFCTLVGGSIWMVVALLFFQLPLNWQLLHGEAIWHMAYLIIGATVITVYLYQVTTVALGPSRVNAYIYLNPALVAILLLLIEGVAIPPVVIPGIILSAMATFILQFKQHKAMH